MKLCAPIYYKDFRCIAGKCEHNCCKAGWEIDIDKETEDLYKNTKDEFGKKINANIDFSSNPHFKLNINGICPFLNKDNLCEIYINLGEDSLCQICTDHPRYYEWFKDVKECGIGLCCEEAARIILSFNKPFSIYNIDIPYEDYYEYDEELYFYLKNVRAKIIKYLDNSSLSIEQKIKNILWYSYVIQQNIDNNLLDDEEIIDINTNQNNNINLILNYFSNLEPNDNSWPVFLEDSLKYSKHYSIENNNFKNCNPDIDLYLKNISIYFVWRYFIRGVFDGDILSKIKLMFLSIFILKYLFYSHFKNTGKLDLADAIDIVRRYSEEIEYSEENIEKIKDDSYEMELFLTENLLNLHF